ncbi:hypothetical protein C7416_103587 [Cupriavidus phytorum]|uniref:Uncharacterized protein n=1 Tax=Cupriavidus phytorum TaxID=3024399 RepID=A0A2W7P3Y7_9BURK|nr:hypothetical protein [Cupriavidus alkaliphilus]PZX30854.1 hypothetical protein C7416_103587 [Cupriavidus alkaliphilus]
MAQTTPPAFGGLSQQDLDWLAVFKSANPVQAADLAAAFDMACNVLRERGYTCATDDRADKLRGALARYVTESQR